MISVIIPVYNAEKYIDQCFQSLLHQTYTDWEAIVIDDGSKDGSSKILLKYGQIDSRFKVTIKENEGVSMTRNRALDMCKGEYIFFLDADDYLLVEDCFSNMVEAIKKPGVDFVRCEYEAVDGEGRHLFYNSNKYLRTRYFNKQVPVADYCRRVAKDEFFLCMNLLKNDIVQNNKIRFVQGCRYREDAAFLMNYFCYAKEVTYLPDEYYAYRKHSSAATSILNQKIYAKDLSLVFDYIEAMRKKCSNRDLNHFMEHFLSTIVVDLRDSEYFENAFNVSIHFENDSNLFNLCKRFGFHDGLIGKYKFCKKVTNKLFVLINRCFHVTGK